MKRFIPWRAAVGLGLMLMALVAIASTPGLRPRLIITDVFPDRDIEELMILGAGFQPDDAMGPPRVILGTQPLDILQLNNNFIRTTLPASISRMPSRM